MKKIIIFISLFFLFPACTFAKTVSMSAMIDSRIKDNITSLTVVFDSSTSESGFEEYTLNKSNDFKLRVSDFPNDDEVNFIYGTVDVNGVADSVGRYRIDCSKTTSKDLVVVKFSVFDTSLTTTTVTTVINNDEEEQEENNENKETKKLISYMIVALVVIILVIVVLIFLIKALRASKMY
ncbi:MAG: hypothetical protein IJS56_03395 [Bacilli bacterium]|nr:hypothetical protein [Bacilli bacterium]